MIFAQHGAATHGVHVGRYVIMPDHVHLFVTGGPEFLPGNWMRLLKQSLGKAVREVSPRSVRVKPEAKLPVATKKPARI